MGNIPKERLFENCKPFTSTGIDYFGPIKVKTTKHTRRNPSLNKRYGVIFVCLTLRAMDLELADNLTTVSVVLVLNRFIARRGHVKVITSANGSSFIGAESELRESIKSLNNERITEHLNSKYVI